MSLHVSPFNSFNSGRTWRAKPNHGTHLSYRGGLCATTTTVDPDDEWAVAETEQGDVYYYHLVTGETAWDKPLTFADRRRISFEGRSA